MHVVAERAQTLRDDGGSSRFRKTEFRMSVQVAPQRNRVIDDAPWNFERERHVDFLERATRGFSVEDEAPAL